MKPRWRDMHKRTGGAGDLLGQALARENMVRAWKRVLANKGSAGVGRTVLETGEYLKQAWPDIRSRLLDGSCRPDPVRRVGGGRLRSDREARDDLGAVGGLSEVRTSDHALKSLVLPLGSFGECLQRALPETADGQAASSNVVKQLLNGARALVHLEKELLSERQRFLVQRVLLDVLSVFRKEQQQDAAQVSMFRN